MRSTKCFLTILVFLVGSFALTAENYTTQRYNKAIASLLIQNTKDWKLPPILRGKDEKLNISFDELNLKQRTVYYRIIYCNADWSKSSISEINFLDGFNNNQLTNSSTSFNTRMNYTHYDLILPNEDVKFKLSGNYAIEIYDDDTSEKLVTACFSIVEPLVNINGKVLFNTDISFKKEYQQLEFSIDYANLRINNPQTELHVKVIQNQRTDNSVENLKPTYIQTNKLIYSYNKKLIFEGGNEYRQFEMITTEYTGAGIDKIRFQAPYYHVYLQEALDERYLSGYIYSQDMNGRTYLKAENLDNVATEGDYYETHFELPIPELMQKGSMYVLGQLFGNQINEDTKMVYNNTTKSYERVFPVKQGIHDYAYVFVPEGTKKATMKYSEGTYYQTENEYLIMVYHRPFGERYDKLIGVQKIESNKE